MDPDDSHVESIPPYEVALNESHGLCRQIRIHIEAYLTELARKSQGRTFQVVHAEPNSSCAAAATT